MIYKIELEGYVVHTATVEVEATDMPEAMQKVEELLNVENAELEWTAVSGIQDVIPVSVSPDEDEYEDMDDMDE